MSGALRSNLNRIEHRLARAEAVVARLMTIDEAAAFLRVSRRQVGYLIERGELPTVRVGQRVRIDIDRWLRQARKAPR